MQVVVGKAANTLVVLASSPMWAALISRFVLGEKIAPRTAVAVVVTFAAVVLVFASELSGGEDAWGLILAVVAALAAAGYFNVVGAMRYTPTPPLAVPLAAQRQRLLSRSPLPPASFGGGRLRRHLDLLKLRSRRHRRLGVVNARFLLLLLLLAAILKGRRALLFLRCHKCPLLRLGR